MTARFKTFFILALMLAFTTPAAAQEVGSPQPLATTPLEIVTGEGVFVFDVEVARTREEMSKGLMFRTELAPDRGMLFDFDQDREVVMWMRNTHVALDMLFIDRSGRIVRIARRTTPFSEAYIRSGAPVRFVLELVAGSAARLGIRPGDRVRHALFADTP